jgi:glyoxylase-like metal-dependent hydrolase (beta-lactamase superfamily II)
MARLIDTHFLGRDRAIGAWERGGVIVDPGPASTVDAVLAGLADTELRAILLTHIHLDHAGATGTLLGRYPGARVFVHEVGAPHLIDPSRLWRSAARLYGEGRMRELWGEMLPVDSRRVTALRGGERVEGMEVLATPGHAAHHVVYLDDGDGAAYVGDVAGVRIPPADLTVMPTPPPELDLEAWLRSIDALADRRPRSLRLAHFGEVGDAAAQLQAARESLLLTAGWARGSDRDRFLERLDELIGTQPSDSVERMRLVMPPEQVWLGLERYWRKRAGDA